MSLAGNLLIANSAEKVTNGTFDTVTTGWTLNQSTLSVVSAAMRITLNTSYTQGYAYQQISNATIIGRRYKVTYQIVAINGGGDVQANMKVGDNSTFYNNSYVQTTPSVGTYTVYFTATGTGVNLAPNCYSATKTAGSVDIDNISLVEVGEAILQGGSNIRPTANSTTAINIAQLDNTAFVVFDSTNKRMGVGAATAPSYAVDVTGAVNASTNLMTAGTTRLDVSGNATLGTVSATSATLGGITSYDGIHGTPTAFPVVYYYGESVGPPHVHARPGMLYYDTSLSGVKICTLAGHPGTFQMLGDFCPRLCVLEMNTSGTMETRHVGNILQGLFAPELEGTNAEDVSGQIATTYAIREPEGRDETSYVSSATLAIDGTVYQPTKITPPRAKSNGRYEIRKGEQLEVTFPVAPRADQTVLFSATGYYEIGEDARGWLGAFRNMQRLTLQRAKGWVQARESAIRADAATAIQKVRDDAAVAIAAERQARLSDKAAFQTELNAIKTRLTNHEI